MRIKAKSRKRAYLGNRAEALDNGLDGQIEDVQALYIDLLMIVLGVTLMFICLIRMLQYYNYSPIEGPSVAHVVYGYFYPLPCVIVLLTSRNQNNLHQRYNGLDHHELHDPPLAETE